MGYSRDNNQTSDLYSGFDRTRVDVGQTSFFEGREFRSFKEYSIAAGVTYVLKVVVPVNTVLFGLELVVQDGSVRLGTYVGGTEGGTFSEVLPVFGANNMTAGRDHRTKFQNGKGPIYAAQNIITAGGTHTGGTELDVILLKTTTASGSAISVGNMPDSERGVAPNTYYFRLLNNGSGTAIGTLKTRWEERPTGFFVMQDG